MGVGLLGIFYNLNHVGLLMSERHLVAHDFILDRVLQRRIEQHLDGLSLDKSHLDDTLAEAAVSRHLDDDTPLASLQF